MQFSLRKKTLLIGAIATTSLLWTGLSAQALTLTHNSVDYNITTRTGTFDNLQPLLSQQPWWVSQPAEEAGARALAEDLAGLLKDSLGLPNVPIQGPKNTLPTGTFAEGPYFALLQNGNEVTEVNFDNGKVEEDIIDLSKAVEQLFDQSGVPITTPARDIAFTFAVVEPTQSVPTPALLPAMLGMGAGVLRRRKKQASASS